MKRREFIKVSVALGVSLAIPIKLYKPESNETMFFKYMIEHVPADHAISITTMYAFEEGGGKNLTYFFRSLVERQPEFARWLKSNIDLSKYAMYGTKVKSKYITRRTNPQLYNSLVDKYRYLKAKFNLKREYIHG